MVYKAEFPEGYLCHSLKEALVEVLRSEVIDFEYEDFLHCNILKESEFSEFLKEIRSWIEPFDYPWYGTKQLYDELLEMDAQNAAAVQLCGKGHFDDANNNIRLFDMKARWRTDAVEWNASVLDSLNHLQYYKDTQWTVCSPKTAGNFSAVAYYFGKMLQDS